MVRLGRDEDRVIALGLMLGNPRLRDFDSALAAIERGTRPFEIYHGLALAEVMVGTLTRGRREQLRRAVTKILRGRLARRDTDIRELAEEIATARSTRAASPRRGEPCPARTRRQADSHVVGAVGRRVAHPLAAAHEHRLAGRDVQGPAVLALHPQQAGEHDGVLVDSGRRPGSLQPAGERMRATLTRSSPLLARPANSSISFGGSPAASTRTGVSINSASWRQRSYAGPMSTAETRWGPGVNAEAIQAWDGPLYDRWVRFRHVVTKGLGAHGDAALALVPPQQGQRVLDVGCGLGDTTQQIAELVGPDGEAVGVDAAERFIETATAEAAEANVANARFFVADVQTDPLDGPYDMAFSRMGTMFFISPVAALRNVCKSLVPGGKLASVVWRRREDNLWMYRAQQIVEGIVQKPEEYDEPTCGPGPFSMANADTLTDILVHSGFTDISLTRSDPRHHGRHEHGRGARPRHVDRSGREILRLQGDRAAHLMPQVDAALREGMAEFVRDDGEVWAPASTWIVTASRPMA